MSEMKFEKGAASYRGVEKILESSIPCNEG
jgi:hypothetical protein